MLNRETVPCKTCGTPTPMLGTKLCDNCFEVEGRLKRYLESARGREIVRQQVARLESPQARLIALLDEMGLDYSVASHPFPHGGTPTGWEVIISQDDSEDPGYYHYIQFNFDLEGQFEDYEIGTQFKEWEPIV